MEQACAPSPPSAMTTSPGPSERPGVPAATKPVSRTIVNFALDALLLVAFVLMGAMSLVVRFVFPRATAAAGWTVWGFGLDDWLDGQMLLIGTLTLIALVHVMLHWNWVCGVVSSRLTRRWPSFRRWDEGVRTLYGVVLLMAVFAVVGLFVGVAAVSIRPPG